MDLKFNRILFDNMSPKNLKQAVKLSNKLYETEASGGITLKNVRKIASTGVKRISVGKITHSASAADFKLDLQENYFFFFKYACAAERRAIGTLYGEQDT